MELHSAAIADQNWAQGYETRFCLKGSLKRSDRAAEAQHFSNEVLDYSSASDK